MTEKDTLNPAALRAARKRANGNRGFTQEQLAERIRCSKDTVSRWERGEVGCVRAHLRKPLCDTLGIEWGELTTPPDPESTSRPLGLIRLQRWVSRHVPPALILVAERYNVRPQDVLDIAPLLFLIAAERSLLERRQRLDEICAVQEEAEQRVWEERAHLSGVVARPNRDARDMLKQEKKSLRARDIFGRLIKCEFRDDDEFWNDEFPYEEEGPFVHFIRSLAEGLPQDAVTSIESSYDGKEIGIYRVADDTLRDLAGVSEDEEGRQVLNHIWRGGIDLGECLSERRKLDVDSYQQWLRDALAESKEASRHERVAASEERNAR